MILTPKRKMVQPDEQGALNQYITQNVTSELPNLALTFSKLWVKSRLRIPVGTDKYGA